MPWATPLRHHCKKQERREDDEVHDALKHRGPAGAQCHHAEEEREREQCPLLLAESEFERLAQRDRHGDDRWDREADGRERRSQRQIQAGLQPIGARRAKRRKAFGQQHQGRNGDPDDGLGRAKPRHARLQGRRECLGETDDGDERCEQQGGADQRCPEGGRFVLRRIVALDGQEVVAVPHRLDVSNRSMPSSSTSGFPPGIGVRVSAKRGGRNTCSPD